MNQPQTQTNEVARLRGEKDKIAEIAWEAVNRLFDVSDSLDEIPLKLQTQLEALDPIPTLAPAPEEAAPCRHSDDVNCRSCHVGEVTGEVAGEVNEPKHEIPLEKMMECFLGDYPDAGKAIYDAIYNLRDEIQKLKEAR